MYDLRLPLLHALKYGVINGQGSVRILVELRKVGTDVPAFSLLIPKRLSALTYGKDSDFMPPLLQSLYFIHYSCSDSTLEGIIELSCNEYLHFLPFWNCDLESVKRQMLYGVLPY